MARTKAPPKKDARTTVVRRSVSLERDVDALAHELVGDANFSAFVNEAMREKAQQIRMQHLLDDLDAEYGPIDSKTKKKAEALWQSASRSIRARLSS
jgi:hypothetical protein